MNIFNEMNRIEILISRWKEIIDVKNSRNLYDINKHSENFCIPFLNLIYDLELENLNNKQYNYPAIDLGDENKKIAFQITSRDDPKKIYDNINNFIKDHDVIKYSNNLIFFLLNKENPKVNEKKILKQINYKVVNYKGILDIIEGIYYKDNKKFKKIKELLEKEFSDGANNINNVLFTLMPPRPIELFGREDEYKNILDFMSKENSMLLINSMGGIGKTELCKQYFWDNYKKYAFSGWINYKNGLKESFIEQFDDEIIKINEFDDYEIRFRKIINCLKNNKSILLIIDNIGKTEEEDIDLQIIRSLPISILVSSKNKIDIFQDRLEIGFLNKEACINLFYKYYDLNEKDDNYLSKIIELAGFHTLAVELLSKTCKASNLKIKELYDKLVLKGFNLNDVIKENISTGWDNFTNRRQFFEHILKVFEISNLAQRENYFLANISVLPSIPINKNDLKEWLGIDTLDDINLLIKKGWINESGSEIKMHNIIKEAVLFQTKPNIGTCYRLIRYFTNRFREKPEESPLINKKLIPFAESILSYINDNEEFISVLYNNLAYVYQTFGYLEKARIFQEKSIEILNNCQLILDRDAIATSYNNLASIYKDLNLLEKAKEYQQIALEMREKNLEKNHPNLAASYNNLSGIFHKLSIQNNNLNDLKIALDLQLKALAMRESYIPEVINSYNNLAQIYVDFKNFDEAFKIQKKVIQIGEKIFNKNHPSLATSYNNFANILFLQGKVREALCCQIKATRIRKIIFDKNHYLIGISYDNLARIYLNLKDFKIALYYCEKAIKILKFNFLEENLELITALKTLKMIKENINENK